MRLTTSASMPKPCWPMRASPLSFRRMRLYLSSLLTQSFSHVGGKVGGTLFQSFAGLETRKAADADVLANLSDRVVDELLDRQVRIFDKCLIVQTAHLIIRLEFAFSDFIDNVFRLSRSSCLILINFFLLVQFFGRNILAAHIKRILRRDMHRDVLHERLKVRAACCKIGFAIHFDQNAMLSAGVNIVSDHAFSGNTGGFLLGGSQALLSQDDDGAFHV